MSRLTLNEAAVKLGLSTRTLRRRIKEGSVYATLDEGKYYLDSNEVDRLSTLSSHVDKGKVDMSRPVSNRLSTPTAAITLSLDEYNRLVYRLGQLEEREQRLIEHQADVETKERSLVEARQRIEELEAKLEKKGVNWLKRLFGRG